ncbi:MAG: hypothetical protein C4520_04260 [Candidatus Abyssobacteria bacterium SURF_5]|uniref:B box-type domain-containing protein n=1 Tax=Abyssobacteria bacterium (strain SURF_5) TaxID=2093360 RepID=A0A3A4NV43_ABYX5|nr:MAG: hypothetical protein C4520_04260 [Candidatus Abyssubacteria bacterium SURF_5]
MKIFQFDCGKCRKPVSLPLAEPAQTGNCPGCGAYLEVASFPALVRKAAPGLSGEKLLVDDESSCFYHSAKKATVACESCGRFLCSLCAIELKGQHLCSTCIERGAVKGKFEHLQNERVRYDDIALFLAVLPLVLFIWGTFITATASIFIAVKHWKSPRSIVYPGRWRSVLAIVISLGQLAVWGYLGGLLFMNIMQ